MAPLAKSTPRPARDVHQFGIDGNDLDASLVQPEVEFGSAARAQAGLDHHGCFEKGRSRDHAHRIVGDSLLQG